MSYKVMAGADTVQRARLPIGAGKSLGLQENIVAPEVLEPSHPTNPLSTISFSYIQAATKQPAARATELFSNVVQVPGLDSDFGNRPIDLGAQRDNSPWAKLSRLSTNMKVYAVALLGSLGLLSESSAGLMKDSNYNNPTTHQQHLDLGRSLQGTVVYISMNGTNLGSGVIINNSRCVLVASHETEWAGTFSDPNIQNFQVHTGPNYLNNTGSIAHVSQIIRHPTRTSPGVGTDSAILILESDLPGAIPTTIATSAPQVGDVMKLIGYGVPAVAIIGGSTYLPETGDIIGGYAPVNTIDNNDIKTKFMITSPQPLIFNATPGHSGGGIFNAQNQLCGIMRTSTSPGTSGITTAVNFTLTNNSSWVQEITSPYNNTTPISPNLGIQKNGNQITLTIDSPLNQNGGTWIPQRSENLTSWADCSEQFIGNTCVITNNAESGFYRMKWVPAP